MTHLPCVVYTRRWRDLFRKRYWVRCFECDLRVGPYALDWVHYAYDSWAKEECP